MAALVIARWLPLDPRHCRKVEGLSSTVSEADENTRKWLSRLQLAGASCISNLKSQCGTPPIAPSPPHHHLGSRLEGAEGGSSSTPFRHYKSLLLQKRAAQVKTRHTNMISSRLTGYSHGWLRR